MLLRTSRLRTYLAAPLDALNTFHSSSSYSDSQALDRARALKIVTTHRDGGEVIKPGPFGIPHGITGWCEGLLLIYNKQWTEAGWYTVENYRIAKARENWSNPDYRVNLNDLHHPKKGQPFIKTGELSSSSSREDRPLQLSRPKYLTAWR